MNLARVWRARPEDPSFDAILMFGPAETLFRHYPGAARLAYLDPPFGTGKTFYLSPYHAPGIGLEREERVAYHDPAVSDDEFHREADELIEATRDALTDDGTIVAQLDTNRAANVRVELDRVFGRENFWGEWVVHAGVSRDGLVPHLTGGFTPQHNTLQIAGRQPPVEARHTPEQRALLAKSLWLDLDTRGHESGYPSEKSAELADRLLDLLTVPGDLVLEGFGGSGAFSLAALRGGRRAALSDVNPRAVTIAWRRLLDWAQRSGGNLAMAIAPDMDAANLVTRHGVDGAGAALVERATRVATELAAEWQGYGLDENGTMRALDAVDDPAGLAAVEIVTERSEIIRIESVSTPTS